MKRNLTTMTACLFLVTVFAVPPTRGEQICKDSIIATSPSSSFTLHDDGTTSQNTTGLMWQRCAMGQEWNGETCSGIASVFSWKEALSAASQQKFAGYGNWRLPNKNELESIVEERCISQAINTTIFPATPRAFFWASSPYAGLGSGAWSVDFNFGVVTASDKSGRMNVRLVRDGE